MAQKGKKDIDPEEMMRRKFRAKCLFRRIGRLAMENTFWLIEDIDEYKGVEDVKRRVEQAVRGKVKKQLLSVKDKALLNKPAEDRTDHEKKYLNRKIGGLKCFKRYPNHVKRKLAAMTYFRYYGPNRVVVRQHQEAHALYFIVSGEVVVSQLVYDGLLEEFVSQEVGQMSTGEMFGEISLLHNIPRTATVTTTDHCEFLMLLREDFKYVLLTSIQKQWDEVRLAMSAFSYFDALDEVSFREGCIVAKMKNFNEQETILGDGVGIRNYVYFILTGRVQMIESLKVFVTRRLGKDYYTLFDPYVPPEPSEQDFEKKWFAAYNKHKSDEMEGGGASTRRSIAIQTRSGSIGQSILKGTTRTSDGSAKISKIEGIAETKTSIDGTKTSKIEGVEETKTSKAEVKEGDNVKSTIQTADGTEEPAKPLDPKRASFLNEETEEPEIGREKSLSLTKPVTKSTQTVTSSKFSISSPKQSMVDSKLILPPMSDQAPRPSVRYSINADASQLTSQFRTKHQLKTFFMQVCIMNPGSTFGFGENMRDRRIIALTPVSCMLIPKMWLLQRNTANIWTRIQYYLSKKIPNKEQLFDEFTKQRVWEKFRKECVDDVVARTHAVNNTTIHDVPYSIRLEEMFGI